MNEITETTTSANVATAFAKGGNGFVNGGPGTTSRVGRVGDKKKKKTEDQKKQK